MSNNPRHKNKYLGISLSDTDTKFDQMDTKFTQLDTNFNQNIWWTQGIYHESISHAKLLPQK